MRRILFGTAVLLVLGCGVEGDSGRVEVYLVDNPDAGAPAPVAAAAATGGAPLAFTGRFEAQAQAFISTDGATWVPLGLVTPKSIQLQHATANSVHGPDHAPTGVYTRARLVLQNAIVLVAAGSTFGSVTVTNPVNITVVGTGQGIVIEKEIPAISVQVEGGLGPTITFDLNAETWITAQAVDGRSVAESQVQQAVSVSYEIP